MSGTYARFDSGACAARLRDDGQEMGARVFDIERAIAAGIITGAARGMAHADIVWRFAWQNGVTESTALARLQRAARA